MNDLEYVIWFLLKEKRMEVEFRMNPLSKMEVLLRRFHSSGDRVDQFLKVKIHDEQKLHEFVLLVAMEFDAKIEKDPASRTRAEE